MRAAPVSKPLASVKKICQAGHTVVFDESGSYVVNKASGEVDWLREDEGNYMLDAWARQWTPVQKVFLGSQIPRASTHASRHKPTR